MRSILGAVSTAVASLAAGMIGGLLVMPVGLILHDVLSWLRVLAIVGVFAALGATWAGTLVDVGGEGVPLKPVLVGTELVSIGLCIIRLSSVGAALARALETNLAYASDRHLAPRMSRPHHRLGRAESAVSADRIRAVLQPRASASDAQTADPSTQGASNHRHCSIAARVERTTPRLRANCLNTSEVLPPHSPSEPRLTVSKSLRDMPV